MTFLKLLMMFCVSSEFAHAEIYKCQEKSGEIIFVDENSRHQNAQCNLVFKDHQTSKTNSSLVAKKHPQPSQAQNFPSVDPQTQQGRDDKRKQILLSEFELEEKALLKAQTSGQLSEVSIHQKNLLLLKKELGALK